MNNFVTRPIRDESPCKGCPDKHKRPACRKGCPKDEAWHKELERVNGNRRDHKRKLDIDYGHVKHGGKK